MLGYESVEDISKAQLSKQINHPDMIETVEQLLRAFPISQERVPPPAATYSRLQQPTDAYRRRLAGLAGLAGLVGNPCVNHNQKSKSKIGDRKSLRMSYTKCTNM